MRRIQWNINSTLNNFIAKNKLLRGNLSKSIHSEINQQKELANVQSREPKFIIEKEKILEKLNLTNPKLNDNEYPSDLVNKAIESNFPIYPKYLKYLLNLLLKDNHHYIFDYKYCNEIILNTFLFYMSFSADQLNSNEKQSIKNIIIYEKAEHSIELERYGSKFNFDDMNKILNIQSKEAFEQFYQKNFKNENENHQNHFPKILYIKSAVLQELIKTKKYVDSISKEANILFYKFSKEVEVDRLLDLIPSQTNKYIFFASNITTKLKSKNVKLVKVFDFPSEEQHSEIKVLEDNLYFMVHDSSSEEKKINELIEKSIHKILEKHSSLVANSNKKLKLALCSSKHFPHQDFINSLQKYNNEILIDIINANDFSSREPEYDFIIDLNYVDFENTLRKVKYLREYYFSGEYSSYYSFIPEFNLDEIQKVRLRENIPVKICNILNEENKKEIEETVKLTNKDEFDVYEQILDKLVNESKNKIHNNGITNLFYHFKRDDKLMEDMIYDFIYENQREYLEQQKTNYSLLTGKEGFITVRISLENSKFRESGGDIKDIEEFLIKAHILTLDNIHNNLKSIFSSSDYVLDVNSDKYQELVKLFEERKIQIQVLNELPIVIDNPFL